MGVPHACADGGMIGGWGYDGCSAVGFSHVLISLSRERSSSDFSACSSFSGTVCAAFALGGVVALTSVVVVVVVVVVSSASVLGGGFLRPAFGAFGFAFGFTLGSFNAICSSCFFLLSSAAAVSAFSFSLAGSADVR